MIDEPDPTDLLQEVLDQAGDGFVELRSHRKRTRGLAVEKGRVDNARTSEHTGVGVRVLVDGAWGFASTDRLEADAVRESLEQARRVARASRPATRQPDLPPVELARGRFDAPGVEETLERPVDEALELVLGLERAASEASTSVQSAHCSYNEVFEEKGVVTSDGARAWTRLVRPELSVGAVAARDGELQRGYEAVGSTGGWECLFRRRTGEALAERAAKTAVDLLAAAHPEGGRKKVLLSPSLVGLLTHEAIGHTVEADFVSAGSCAAGMLGERVASELVTLCDSGRSELVDGAGGTIDVDDEGVEAGRCVIIDQGRLVSYLHDRASAARYETAPTGNARAWEYGDAPLIRMRNTYIEPGQHTLEELIARTDDGLLLDGCANGQADANGEFMFGTREAYPIRNGQLGPLMRGANISGVAFDVLKTVDGVGDAFRWDLGAGHCGKGQPAKVDAGGPWLSCEVLVGGRQA
ncbi:MAG: TldD/PmbA family protein [Planctomycetota bacterium]|jgi:TldD protein|nr:TldD/PmbA family protein [Planctomycetota bacterium]MDP6990034.1 TldD/PmbA family protein [Planctomycetota bacterium]